MMEYEDLTLISVLDVVATGADAVVKAIVYHRLTRLQPGSGPTTSDSVNYAAFNDFEFNDACGKAAEQFWKAICNIKDTVQKSDKSYSYKSAFEVHWELMLRKFDEQGVFSRVKAKLDPGVRLAAPWDRKEILDRAISLASALVLDKTQPYGDQESLPDSYRWVNELLDEGVGEPQNDRCKVGFESFVLGVKVKISGARVEGKLSRDSFSNRP
ncbi:hypothetical protein F4780DRAFT_359496 [Xylariomycetidae sp. FL0641]|nr:hypothetical protein F4780DRAFT_359496 [Xylariomycetidae sp. FL0641]